MLKAAFAVKHQINNTIRWYGSKFNVLRKGVNEYGEPVEDPVAVLSFNGIYHESRQSFLDLLNTEATQVKAKTNKGILSMVDERLNDIVQGDFIDLNGAVFNVTAVEPVMFSDTQIATEVSLEEVVDCGN